MGTPEPIQIMEHLQRSMGSIEEKMSLMLNDSSPSSTLDNLNHYMAQTKYLFTIAYTLNTQPHPGSPHQCLRPVADSDRSCRDDGFRVLLSQSDRV